MSPMAPLIVMFRGDLQTHKTHFERLKEEHSTIAPRGRFELLVTLLRSINEQFPGLVTIPSESNVFAGNFPEGHMFNVDTLILAIDAALSRLDSLERRPDLLGSAPPRDPLVTMVSTSPKTQDDLTGLGDRKALFADLEEFVRFGSEVCMPIACIVVDIDDFKKFNDQYGHQQGDRVLRATAACVLTAIRGKGRGYRYGGHQGDEFVALLANFESQDARGVGDRIRTAVTKTQLPDIATPITVTVGVAAASPGECSAPDLLKRADDALLLAKRKGKRITVVFGEQDESADHEQKTATSEELASVGEWLENDRWELRKDACLELVRLVRAKRVFHVEEFRSAPRKLLKDPNRDVRMLALEIIGAMTTLEGEQVSRCYAMPLINVVDSDDDNEVRARAVVTIGNTGDIRFLKNVCDWIGNIEQRHYTAVWPIAGLHGLAQKHRASVVAELRKRLEAAETPAIRARFAEALMELSTR